MDENLALNLKRQELMAAEVNASAPYRRSWIGIYSHYPKSADLDSKSAPAMRFRVRWFEVPVRELEARAFHLEGDEDFIVERHDETLDSIEDLDRLLSQLGFSSTEFTYSSRCNYPI